MKSNIILFSGRSCSGKSTIVKKLVAMLGPELAAGLSGDSYYRDLSGVDPEIIKNYNFDDPHTSLDNILMQSQLRQLKESKSVQVPVYDFVTHSRIDHEPLEPKPLILLDSILGFAMPEIVAEAAYIFFVNYPSHLCLARRIERDTKPKEEGGRGRTITSVLLQWQRDVEPMYRLHIKPRIPQANLIIPGDFQESTVIMITAALKALFIK